MRIRCSYVAILLNLGRRALISYLYGEVLRQIPAGITHIC